MWVVRKLVPSATPLVPLCQREDTQDPTLSEDEEDIYIPNSSPNLDLILSLTLPTSEFGWLLCI